MPHLAAGLSLHVDTESPEEQPASYCLHQSGHQATLEQQFPVNTSPPAGTELMRFRSHKTHDLWGTEWKQVFLFLKMATKKIGVCLTLIFVFTANNTDNDLKTS